MSDDPLTVMLQVALEDPTIRQQLLALLELPQAIRTRQIADWLTALKQEGAPEPLLQILGQLQDEQQADAALGILINADNY